MNCGVEYSQTAKFCSGCGLDLSAAPAAQTQPYPLKKHDWDLHISILAWVTIAHAALTAMIGLIVMVSGRFIQRMFYETPNLIPPDMPPNFIYIIGPASFLIGLLFLIISAPSILAGVGLLYHRQWGRILTLVMSFIRLLEFPFGTATSIYAFWVLLSQGGREFYKNKSTVPETLAAD